MIARQHQQLAALKRASELREEAVRGRQRFARGAVTQLEHVAQQHHPIGACRRRQQRGAQLALVQQVRAGAAAEMQI